MWTEMRPVPNKWWTEMWTESVLLSFWSATLLFGPRLQACIFTAFGPPLLFGPPLVRHLVRVFFLVHTLVLPPFGPPFGPRFWCAHLCPPFGPQLSRTWAVGGNDGAALTSTISPYLPIPPPQGDRTVRVDFPRQMVGTLSHEKQLKDINMHRYTQIPKHILASTT